MNVAHRADHDRIVITGSNLGKLYWIRQEVGLVGKAPVKSGIIPLALFLYLVMQTKFFSTLTFPA